VNKIYILYKNSHPRERINL